ncbi:MAG: carboxypeptidase regulatory-like domain-containing protein [Bryobacter sp.]|nr:carboxypeptidase regulatory-like domain-containing protein [Bryobacter sp.]
MRQRLLLIGAIASLACAQDAGLEIRRVSLYKNGVGYFEHLGRVQGTQEVSIKLSSGQLDDVLKSLTVLDLGKGRVSGVTYGTSDTASRQLSDLRLNLSSAATLTEFLNSLRGARVEIRNGAVPFAGRLISVERKTGIGTARTVEVDQVSLLSDSGEVKTVEVSTGSSIKLLEKGLTGSLDRYLNILSSSRSPDERQLRVSTVGEGARELFVSYLSEVPVWKSTYRIVLAKDRKPLLQGWAIVDNTVGQDWNNVQLSLVAGAPQTFVQKLSLPYYSRRPVVDLPQAFNLTPQTYEAAVLSGRRVSGRVLDASGAIIAGATVKVFDDNGQLAGEGNSDSFGRFELAGLPGGNLRLDVAQQGFKTVRISGINLATGDFQQDVELQVGSIADSITVTASVPSLNTSTGTLDTSRTGRGSRLGQGSQMRSGRERGGSLEDAAFTPSASVSETRAAMQSAASGAQLGDLFEYKLKEPITIRKNESALVPIAQTEIEAEKVSIWNERSNLPRPLRALWLKNTSNMTLDGGSFSVLESEAFAGEGLLETLQAGERRLVSYAADLAVVPDRPQTESDDLMLRATASKGQIILQRRASYKKTYRFRNNDKEPRTVIVEHPREQSRQLVNELVEESTPTYHRFRLQVPAQQTASLVVAETRDYPSVYQISKLNEEQLEELSVKGKLSPDQKKLLDILVEKQSALDALEEEQEALEREANGMYEDQERLRENIKALKGSAEEKALLQRYVGELNAQETRLAEIKKLVGELKDKIMAAEMARDTAIAAIVF